MESTTALDPGEHDQEKRLSRLEQRVSELNLLLKSGRDLSRCLKPTELYSRLSSVVRRRIGAEMFSIFIYREKIGSFRLVYTFGGGETVRDFMFENSGALWQRLERNEPISLRDDRRNPLYPEFHHRFNFDRLHADWLVPLKIQTQLTGFMAIGGKPDTTRLDKTEVFFLEQIAAHAAVCINTCHLYQQHQSEKEDLDRTLYNLSLLYGIGRAMTYISDLKSLLQYILNQAIEITGAEKGSIMLYDIEKNLLSIRVLAGLKDKAYQKRINNNEIRCRSFRPGEGIAGRVFQTGRPMVVDKASEDELFVDPAKSFVRSIACIPMKVYTDVIGVINVTNKLDDTGFKDQEVELLKAVADQAAVAINKAQLWEMAVTDSLTGLFVRRYFMVKLQEEFHRAERYKKRLAVVMVDLDGFKSINDAYGHAIGDRVLKIVASFLRDNIRDVDIVARFGGEEFVILLPEADKEEALTVSERLRSKLESLKFDSLPGQTISIGLAAYPEDGKSVEGLIKKADAAMYAAKQGGKNRVVVYQNGMEQTRVALRNQDGSGMRLDAH